MHESVSCMCLLHSFFFYLFNSPTFQRRMHGGRRLWESKDDKKWGHDKFEEISVQDRRYDEVMIFIVLCDRTFILVQLSFF